MTDNVKNTSSHETARKAARVPSEPKNARSINVRDIILGIVGVVLVAAIVFGLLMAFDQNFRATVLQSKYETYTYTNTKNQQFSLLFYRGSGFGTSRVTNSQSIIAPKSINGGVQLEMTIVSYPKSNTSAKAVVKELQQCSFNSIKYRYGFSFYVPAVKSNARVCLSSNYPNGKPFSDDILFASNTTDYFVEVDQNFNVDLYKSSTAYDKQVNPYIGLSTGIQNDIKTIIASIQPH